MKKKIVSLVLSAAMAFSVMSVPAFAAAADESENCIQQIVDSLTSSKYTYPCNHQPRPASRQLPAGGYHLCNRWHFLHRFALV